MRYVKILIFLKNKIFYDREVVTKSYRMNV